MSIKWFQGFALIVILSLVVSACGGVQPLNGEPVESEPEATESVSSGVDLYLLVLNRRVMVPQL